MTIPDITQAMPSILLINILYMKNLYSLFLRRLVDSSAKDEKVVKPPRKPTVTAILIKSGRSMISKRANAIPIIKEPRRLAVSVPIGKDVLIKLPAVYEIKNLQTAPIPPLIKINNMEISIWLAL